MHRCVRAMIALFLLMLSPIPARSETRALLVACSDFITQPDLGSAISGNLHMIGSALLGAQPALENLSIEDGTIGTPDELAAAVNNAFGDSNEDDLSILYLCTHGMLSSADDGQSYLLLGDGETETPLSSADLYRLLSPIQGEKLLILDACFSGALLGRGIPDARQPDSKQDEPRPFESDFFNDSSMHVLTSASGRESSWYYDSEGLQNGAVSYFASALSGGLGLYGSAEADLNGDGSVTLAEMHRYLSMAVPSSSSQLLSCRADDLILPTTQGAHLSRSLSDFSYGTSLLHADDPVFDFSFTATQETTVQYRLVEFEDGEWNWDKAQTFLDGDAPVAPGRHTRSLTLPTVSESDSGYLMLQIFSLGESGLILCSERLIAVQPEIENVQMSLTAPECFNAPGHSELPIDVSIGVPAEITVSILNESGQLIRRLAAGQLTRPSDENVLHLYWDGLDADGNLVPGGSYLLTAETFIHATRVKATVPFLVSGG